MPRVRITNKTSVTLNFALAHICPLHHENSVAPGASWETSVGRVWFTFECREDRYPKDRYSISKSARTIAMVSLAAASVAVVAGPMAITAAAAATTSATVAAIAGSGAMAVATSAEVLAVTTLAASQLTVASFRQVASDNGMTPEEIDEMMSHVSIVNGIVLSAVPAGALVSAGSSSKKKALKAAGTIVAGRVFDMKKGKAEVQANTQKEKGAGKVGGLADGRSFRVMGIYVGRNKNFEWRDKVGPDGSLGAELWDVDAGKVIS